MAIAGIPEITIGETLSDPDNPTPLPLITVDEPSISMTIGINTSPLAGRAGKKLTARLVKARLDAELVGNVSIRVLPTERPDTWEVQGRGELQLAILVEMMRRESYELTVGKPQVVTREIDGRTHEPVERLTIDAPEDFVGVVTQLIGTPPRPAGADGQPRHRLGPDGVPGAGPRPDRLPHRVPDRDPGHRADAPRVRGLRALGRRDPHPPDRIAGRRPDRHGDLVRAVQPAGAGQHVRRPGTEVYEGMIVGENARAEDMDVNPTKEKKLTNVRSSTGDELERLIPPRLLSMEQALEFCRGDECLEVTPAAVRMRKVVLSGNERARTRSRAKQA